ncbi:MAG: site-2 protease family protein [Oscillospiraceae bacterium]|nr:site-2 protease family protein [Oscillospiraceae bacterium]
MSMVFTIAIAILIFFIIITVHELGHYLAARYFKMRVYEFSLGIGPRFFKKVLKDGTLFSLKVLPIGGSVQLGEDYDDEKDNPAAFRNKPVWQRMIVIVAGAVFNLVLGLIACIVLEATNGEELVWTPKIHSFREDAVSNQMLREGDEILQINGASIRSSFDFYYSIFMSEPNEPFTFLVKRDGDKLSLEGVEFNTIQDNDGETRVLPDIIMVGEPKNAMNVMTGAFGLFSEMSIMIMRSLYDIITGTHGITELAGPVGVVNIIDQSVSSVIETSETVSEAFSAGLTRALWFFALISINVGVFNLLPIPALDGARLVFFVVELIRRKPIRENIEGMIHFFGFAALMLLMLVVTFNDIWRVATNN